MIRERKVFELFVSEGEKKDEFIATKAEKTHGSGSLWLVSAEAAENILSDYLVEKKKEGKLFNEGGPFWFQPSQSEADHEED